MLFRSGLPFGNSKSACLQHGFCEIGADRIRLNFWNPIYLLYFYSAFELQCPQLRKAQNRWLPFDPCKTSDSRIYFTTLTFATRPSEAEAKADLKKFIAHLRPTCFYYFWCMEKSGQIGDNIHFHLLLDLPTNTDFNALTQKWQRITKSSSPFASKVSRIYDYKGLIEYLLKGHEHTQEGRQFGLSRSLADMKPIKLDKAESQQFIEVEETNLSIFKRLDYFTILIPNAKLKAKITKKYIFKYTNRKSEIIGRSVPNKKKFPDAKL